MAVALLALLAALPLRADLAAARAEPNLEKRARMALDNATSAFKAAQNAYNKGEMNETQALVEEVSASVTLAYESLKQTGKNASRDPRHFKSAEIRTRQLLRQMSDFRQQMSALDRDGIERAHAIVQKVHDDLLSAIMGVKKP